MTPRAQTLNRICGAYDFRGRTTEDFDPELVMSIGYATHTVMADVFGSTSVLIAHDMRTGSAELASNLCHGVRIAGGTPILVGLASTDQLYFGSGELGIPGIMVTASHNPPEWNGFKICGPGARGIAKADLLGTICDIAAQASVIHAEVGAASAVPWPADERQSAVLQESFVTRLHALTRVTDTRPLTVVADAGNGMAGLFLDRVFSGSNITLIGLYTELDGTFPNHPANPLDFSTLTDVQAAVVAHGADVGLAFDGDADRCFFINEKGETTWASSIGALVATREIARAKAAGEETPTVLHNALTTRAVANAITQAGGKPVRTPVGHSGIKQRMRELGAVFAAEHSAHFYFRDFYCADSGILAACHVISALGETNQPLSALLEPYSQAFLSGEINSTVTNPDAALERIKQACERGDFGPGEVDLLDGITFNAPDFWFNVRKSNTEPLVRFNAESMTRETTDDLTTRVLAVIRQES